MASDEERHEAVTYHEDEVAVGLLARIGVGTVVISLTLSFLVVVLLHFREHQLRPSRHFPEKNLPAPHEVSKVLEAPYQVPQPVPSSFEREQDLLDSWGWVDRQQRLARLPVAVGMELVLRQTQAGGGQ